MKRRNATGAGRRRVLPARLCRLAAERERGSVTVELVIATPALLLLLMVIVQFGLIWSAQQAAQTAASEAVNTARAQGASQAYGQAQGEATLAQLASSELPDGQVSVSLSGGVATVTVTGHPESLIPGWHPVITAHASAPIETPQP
jgi:Flp pilus assembly protein TadG